MRGPPLLQMGVQTPPPRPALLESCDKACLLLPIWQPLHLPLQLLTAPLCAATTSSKPSLLWEAAMHVCLCLCVCHQDAIDALQPCSMADFIAGVADLS